MIRMCGGPAVVAAALWVTGGLAGCIEHHPVTPEVMDRHWTLHADPAAGAPLAQPKLSGETLPARWILRRETSLLRSTISIVQALDRLEAGAESIEVGISDEHAEVLAGMLADVHAAVEDLRAMAERSAAGDYGQWAPSLAAVLVQLEGVARLAEGGAAGTTASSEPVGLSARPLLEMLATYLNERTGGALLGDLEAEDVHRMRQVLTHLVLRAGFALAGRELPAGLPAEVLERLAAAEDPDQVQGALAERLSAVAEGAAPAPPGDALASGLRTVLTAAAKGTRVLEGFVRQWDRVERVEAALHERHGQTVLAGTLAVRPGREVRVLGVVPFQPVVAFRGTSRIAVLPADPRTGEVVVSFGPGAERDGGVELRFEGIVYALARLLVLPIEDARLREVRVLPAMRTVGTGLLHVAVFLEARRGADRRRLLVYKEVRSGRLVRGPLSVAARARTTARTFSYVTPAKRYTYVSRP